MAFTAWGFIYLGTGQEDSVTDRAVIEVGGLRTTVVAVGSREEMPTVAAELIASGAQTIELCGAFTSADVTAARQAVGPGVPIGAVRYDMDDVPHLARIFG